MARYSRNAIEKNNARNANVFEDKGKISDLITYIISGNLPRNFILSGQIHQDDKYLIIKEIIRSAMGTYPILIIHNSTLIENLAATIWEDYHRENIPLWMSNRNTDRFEPFYGMSDIQVQSILRKMGEIKGRTITPRFSRVCNAHFSILHLLEIPMSLTGLCFLCRQADMEKFYENIMELPCSHDEAQRIWANMGIETQDDQFYLFRDIIDEFAQEATNSGWQYDTDIGQYNCSQAIDMHALFTISLNIHFSKLIQIYIVEELKNARERYLLLLDNIYLIDTSIAKFLTSPNEICTVGIIQKSVISLMSENELITNALLDNIDCFIMFKQGTATAAKLIADVWGKYDYVRIEEHRGRGRKFLSPIPSYSHVDQSILEENRYRVMPEEIMDLDDGEAIIFEKDDNTITFFVIR